MKQTQLAIVFNGKQLTKTEIANLEDGFAKVISEQLAGNKKYRNHSMVRDLERFTKPLPGGTLVSGIVVDFQNSILSKINFDAIRRQ